MRIAAVLGARKMSATSTAGRDNGRVLGGWLHLVQQHVERMVSTADRIKVADAIRAMYLTTGCAASCFTGPIKFDDKGRRENVLMIFAQWQKGVPVTVFPEDLALALSVWRVTPKISAASVIVKPSGSMPQYSRGARIRRDAVGSPWSWRCLLSAPSDSRANQRQSHRPARSEK
jgi:hypothetical protein